jgi:hypothetical protein
MTDPRRKVTGNSSCGDYCDRPHLTISFEKMRAAPDGEEQMIFCVEAYKRCYSGPGKSFAGDTFYGSDLGKKIAEWVNKNGDRILDEIDGVA